jgi:hypothetical protein
MATVVAGSVFWAMQSRFSNPMVTSRGYTGHHTSKPGDYIKVEFPDEATGVAEWMWGRVRSCDDAKKLVFGTVNNAPVSDSSGKLKLGTELAVSNFADAGASQSLNTLTLLYFS